ncbi:MAG: acyltransferase family protein [Janthinobacterium lividum]
MPPSFPLSEPPRNTGHIRALDGVRGAAVTMVFVYHALFFSMNGGTPAARLLIQLTGMGWAGVDVFFVLSGFLITTILLKQRETQNYFRVFYARRLLRLSPLYYLVVAGALLLMRGRYSHKVELLYWLNFSNFPTAFQPLSIPFLAHLWSLAIEEQFYLIWPAVVRFFRVRTVALLCGTVMVVLLCVRNFPSVLAMNAVYPEFVYRLTPFRLDTLCSGALLAILVKYRGQWMPSRRVLRIAFLAFAVLFVSTGGRYLRDVAVTRYGYTSLLLASCALVALCLEPASRTARFFSAKALTKLGQYSYAIYLFHPFVLRFGAAVLDRAYRPGPAQVVPNAARLALLPLEFACTYGLAAVSWRLIEEPFLKKKSLFRYEPGIRAASSTTIQPDALSPGFG